MKRTLRMLLALSMILSLLCFPTMAVEEQPALIDNDSLSYIGVDTEPTTGIEGNQDEYRKEDFWEKLNREIEEQRKTNRFIIIPKEGMYSEKDTLAGVRIQSEASLYVGNGVNTQYTVITLADRVLPEEFIEAVAGSVEFIQPDYELELATNSDVQNNLSVESGIPPKLDGEFLSAGETGTIPPMKVALLDTGVDMTHPDLADRFVDGWNFIENNSIITAKGVSFGEAHGTHIAGIISSTAPDAFIMPLQVFEQGKAYTSDVIRAIQYAEAHGAALVNCSWGSNHENQILKEVIETSNMIFVAAAGNQGQDLSKAPFYPASYDLDNVICVASVEDDGSFSYFSNYGKIVDAVACGTDIRSTVPGGYGELSGTSISSGFISGAVIQRLAEGADILEIQAELYETIASDGIRPFAVDAVSEESGEDNSVQFDDLKSIKVSSSASFSMVLKEDGTVWAWGNNNWGQCGNSDIPEKPVQIPGLNNIVDISAGVAFGYALDKNYNLWSWGRNDSGVLGDGTTVSRSVPMKVTTISYPNEIWASGGENVGVIVCTDGSLWTLGQANKNTDNLPEKLQGADGVRFEKGVYAYSNYIRCFVALDISGNLWEWNLKTTPTSPPNPQKNTVVTDAVDIEAGLAYVAALRPDGTIWARGDNMYNIFGFNLSDTTYIKEYQQLYCPLEDGFKSIEKCGANVLALSRLGEVYFYGHSIGNGGDGEPIPQPRPYPIRSVGLDNKGVLYDAIATSGGLEHTVTIMADGTAIASGMNRYGVLGVSPKLAQTLYPIKVGGIARIPILYQSAYPEVRGVSFFEKDISPYVAQLKTVPVRLDDNSYVDVPASWDIEKAELIKVQGSWCYSVPGVLCDFPEDVKEYENFVVYCRIYLVESNVAVSETFEPLYVPKGTEAKDLSLPAEVLGYLSTGNRTFPIKWNTSKYDPTNTSEAQTITGKVELPDGYKLEPAYTPTIEVWVVDGKAIAEVPPCDRIEVRPGTEFDALNLAEEVRVILTDGSTRSLKVDWINTYDKTKVGETQTLFGNLILADGITNPDNLLPQVDVFIRPEEKPIISITPVVVTAKQNYLLGPTDRTHPAGPPPSVAQIPDKVWVNFDDGDRAQLPVLWEGLDSYDKRTPGQQDFTGEVVIDDKSGITNEREIPATLTINVVPESYYVWVGDTDYFPSVSFEVVLGTPVEKLDEILEQEGKKEVPFIGYGSVGAYLFEDVTITGEQPGYDQATPGTYTLTAYLPDNFMDMDTGGQGYIPVSVTVLEPSDAVSVEAAHMETRQSIQPKYMENIPTQVNVVLENGKTVQSEVEWSWAGYNLGITGIQEIPGTLKNPPAAIKQPISETLEVKLQVNVLPAEYTVTGIENNVYTGDAGLTLEELNEKLVPWITLNIESEDGVSTKFDITVSLKADGSDFDPTQAKEYVFAGDQIEVLHLPENITWPATVEKTVTLTTNKVLAEEAAELLPVTVGEGTPFDEVELPEQVLVRLSCKTSNGASKEMLVDIDWGSGEGYTPVPESWGEDGTAAFTVTGALTGCAGYISNAEEIDIPIQIRMTPAPKLLAITPWLFPDSGALEVGVGTSLDEIYTMLGGEDNTHTVRLALEDYLGEPFEKEMTYLLRAEDNTHYDPATSTGAIRLNAYLPLGDKIKNPNGLKVQIQISVNQYTITGAQVIRLTRPIGLPFEELDLPEKAMVTRDDGKEEWLDVTWDSSRYNPNRQGMQPITGTLNTPLPAHLTNPNNIQPRIFLSLTDPTAQILSLTPVEDGPMALAAMDMDMDEDLFFNEDIPGIIEHRYWAEILHEDGTITIEPYSEFEVVDEELKAYITYEEDVR